MKKQERIKAIELRKDGKSVREIAKVIRASKGSISYWVRDVKLTNEQKIKLIEKQKMKGLVGRNNHSENCFQKRLLCQNEGRKMAKNCTKEYVMGCMLFWAEGTKSRTSVIFSNTDEDMVVFFVNFLKKYFGCQEDDFSLRLDAYLNNGLTASDLEKFWVEKLGLNMNCLRKSVFKRGDENGGKYPHGVCYVMIHNVNVVQKIYGSIQELTGFKKDEWIKLRAC